MFIPFFGNRLVNVVGGTTRPSNPAVNTIWVNTSTVIGRVFVQNTTPEYPSAGNVWITLKPSIGNTVNIADDRMLFMVGFGVAYQYISNAWVTMDAELFDGGNWQGLLTYVYNLGDTCVDICGGWKHLDSGSNNRDEFLSDHMHSNYTSTTGVAGMFITNEDIDLTEFTKIVIDYEVARGNTGSSYTSGLYITTANNTYTAANNAKTALLTWHVSSKMRGNAVVDITNITGAFYIGLYQHFSEYNTYRIWLEK